MALALALLAIVVIGALVSGTFFAGRLEMAAGRNTVYTAQATEAAEAGLATAFGSWNSAWNAYTIGTDNVQSSANPISGNTSVRYTNTVRRMQGGNYMITSTGQKLDRNGNILASRILAEMGKLATAEVDIQAAVTSQQGPEINGTADVSGFNFTPTGWTGCGTYSDLAGVRTAETVGGNHPQNAIGNPAKIENDNSLDDSDFTGPFNSLLPLKTHTVSGNVNGVEPSVSGGVCDKTDQENWGEPWRGGGSVSACYNYFPVVYSAGNLRVNNTRGQGILLVAGDLDLHGNFNWYGLIIVLGTFTTSGTDNVYGAVLVMNDLVSDETVIGGNVLVQWSGCAVAAALAASARGVPLVDRKWAQVNPR
jgi:hypothetical protein